MLLTLKQNELEFDKMSDDATELVHVTGESRISVNIQQITSRFQGIQSTAKVNLNLDLSAEFTYLRKKI
jgi:nesprin-1